MKVGSGSGINLNVALFQNVQGGQAGVDETALLEAEAGANPLAGHEVRRDLMAGSFVQADGGPSRYIQGAMIGLQVQSEFKTRMGGILDQYRLQAQAADGYAEKALAGQKAAEAVGDMVDGEVADKAAERMAREREEDEAKAAEKLEEKAAGKAEEQSGDAEGAPGTEADGRDQAAPGEAAEDDATASALDLQV